MTRTDCGRWLSVAAAALLQLPAANAYSQDRAATDDRITQEQYAASLRGARDSLMAAGDFDAALEPAEIIVAELESQSAAAAAGDRVMLAVILAELERFDEAELRMLEAVDALQDAEGQYTASTVLPLHLLGRTYIRARRFPQAITVLDEARSISRRTAGLFNVDQAGVLDDLTTAHLGLGDTVTARDLQIERLATAQRQFGAADPRVIPYHYHLADYYERSRLLAGAKDEYDAALEIATAAGDTLQMLVALRRAGALELRSGHETATIQRLRQHVTATASGGHELGLAHAVLGDAAVIAEDHALARQHYAAAWTLLAAGDEVDPAVFFADPAVIRFVPPATDVDLARRSLPYTWGTVSIELDVGEHGRVETITSVGARPAGMMEDAYVERLRGAWFRPALIDAAPAAATGVVFTHYFRYYVDPDETAPDEAEPDED